MGSENDAENPPAEPAEPAEPADKVAEAEQPEAPAAPKKKKKKKKRAEAIDAEVPRGPVHAPDGSERPAFVLDFPNDPELAKLVTAFEAGNYAYVREHAGDLAERPETDPKVRRAANELLTRIEPDPLIRFVLAVSVLLLLFLTYYAYSNHGH
jgi:hypothetical protein